MIAFTMLKDKIAKTPILKHFDPDRIPVIVVYASKWAVSAALLQEHDGVYWPVTFSSRTLKPNEVNYGMVEKEVLALLRMLDVGYTMLAHARSLFLRDIQRWHGYYNLLVSTGGWGDGLQYFRTGLLRSAGVKRARKKYSVCWLRV